LYMCQSDTGLMKEIKKKIENCHRNILGHPVALSVCMCERDTELIIEIKNN
jgi:hypothetical protein